MSSNIGVRSGATSDTNRTGNTPSPLVTLSNETEEDSDDDDIIWEMPLRLGSCDSAATDDNPITVVIGVPSPKGSNSSEREKSCGDCDEKDLASPLAKLDITSILSTPNANHDSTFPLAIHNITTRSSEYVSKVLPWFSFECKPDSVCNNHELGGDCEEKHELSSSTTTYGNSIIADKSEIECNKENSVHTEDNTDRCPDLHVVIPSPRNFKADINRITIDNSDNVVHTKLKKVEEEDQGAFSSVPSSSYDLLSKNFFKWISIQDKKKVDGVPRDSWEIDEENLLHRITSWDSKYDPFLNEENVEDRCKSPDKGNNSDSRKGASRAAASAKRAVRFANPPISSLRRTPCVGSKEKDLLYYSPEDLVRFEDELSDDGKEDIGYNAISPSFMPD